jgi:hypothetical protein
LLIEIIRSSVLRVREYYADSRTAIWMGKSRPLLQLILGRQADSQTALTQQAPGWAGVRAQLRARLAPFHPEAGQRAQVLKDERLLFEPGHGIAFLAGIATGIALASNFALVGIAFNSIGQLLNALNRAASTSNDLSFVTFIFYLVTILIVVTVGFMLIILILFALLPTVATVGIDIQKAAFADQFQPASQQLLPAMRLVSLAFIFGLGTVSGSFLSPALGPLTPGSLAIGTRALLLLPLFILGWSAVFLLWFIPLRKLAGQLYVAHRTAEPPVKKRRWLIVISAAALLPMLGQMSLTQTLLSAYVGFPADFATQDFQELAQFLIGGGWMVATLFTIVIWLVGWAWLKIRGWLQHTANGRAVPLWAAVPDPYRLPGPPLAPAMDGPPPL